MKGGSAFDAHALVTMSTSVPDVFAISGAMRCKGELGRGDLALVWTDGG